MYVIMIRSMENQKLFYSSVGMPLYQVKHSRPDITNSTWVLSKVNDRASKARFLGMHHVTKYKLDTRTLVLEINHTGDRRTLGHHLF